MSLHPVQVITGHDPSSFDLGMTDDGLVTFGAAVAPDAVSFSESGFMPITQMTVAGDPLQLQGRVDGLFIKYSATGSQSFGPGDVPPSAAYDSLHYELIGYKGDATFGRAADGTPTVSGIHNEIVLAQGDLQSGQLAFTATGGIEGKVAATFTAADGGGSGSLDLTVQHAAGDVGLTGAGLTLSGGDLTAVFVPASS